MVFIYFNQNVLLNNYTELFILCYKLVLTVQS